MNEPQTEALTTEAPNPRTDQLDRMDALTLARVMNDEDRLVAEVVRSQLPTIARAVEVIAERLRQGGRLVYCGAGTSGRLGVLDAAECRPTFSAREGQVLGQIAGGDTAMLRAVEGAEDDPKLGENDLRGHRLVTADCVVGISASGRTPYVLGALAHAATVGAATLAIVCNANSAVAAAADLPIEVVVGPEVLTGSTRLKAGTATKLVVNMLSTGAFVRLHKVYGNLMVDLQTSNDKLRDRSVRIVSSAAAVDRGVAARTLSACGGEVKRAIVVLLRKCAPEEAAALLAGAAGSVRAVVEPPT